MKAVIKEADTAGAVLVGDCHSIAIHRCHVPEIQYLGRVLLIGNVYALNEVILHVDRYIESSDSITPRYMH